MAVARSAIAARAARAIFGVSVANSTAVSTGPMVAKNVVKLLSAVSIMGSGYPLALSADSIGGC